MHKRSKLGIYTSLIISSIIGGSIIGGCIAYPTVSANVDKLELLNRAVENDSVKALARARGDIIIADGGNGNTHWGAYIGNRLYMWGDNSYGKLGLGDTSFRSTPTWVTSVTGNVTQLALGANHSGAIINGTVYMWGYNGYGQLGLGHTGIAYTPASNGWSANKLALGANHSGLIDTSGRIAMWGYNTTYASCGIGNRDNNVLSPRYISTNDLAYSNYNATDLSLGSTHSAAIINSKLYTWGGNDFGELGYSASPWEHYAYAHPVNDLNKKGTPSSISLGGRNSGAVVGGRVYTWGQNNVGQLGIGKTSNWEWVTQVNGISNVTKLEMSGAHALAINGGYLYSWGSNSNGQLGVGNTSNYSSPVSVSYFGNNVSQISVANSGSFAVENGELYWWGWFQPSTTLTKQKLTITESLTINLTSSNDPYNMRDEVVYNLTDNDMINIIEPSNSRMNLPRYGTYGLYSQVKIGSTPYNGTRTGRLSLRVSSSSFPVQTNITFYGLKPVNLTQDILLDPIVVPVDDKVILGLSPEDLVNEANADATGTNSKLAKWIMANVNLFTESESKYTVNFPVQTKITKVDTFDFTDWKKGEITFNIYVDKYYKQSGQDYILSTSSDAPIKITKKVTLSGLTSVISLEDCVDKDNKIVVIKTEIEPQTTADKFFLAVSDNINGGVITNQALLREYIDIRFIPFDAIISIKRIPIIDPTGEEIVNFTLTSSKYYETGRLKTNDTTPPRDWEVRFIIRPKSSEILVREDGIAVDNKTKITTGDAIALMKQKNDVINIGEAEKYLNFQNFPLNTTYNSIPSSIINENEKGILSLSINANQYYDLSSVHAVYNNKAFNNIEITGFKPAYDLSKYPLLANQNQFQSFSSANNFYSEVINENSGTVNRSSLANYIDLKAIPDDATLTITRVEYNENDVIKFIIKTNKYYDDKGTTINQEHEQEILVKLPKFDWMLIIYIGIGLLFLIVIITCIIISVKNKRSVKYDEIIEI